MPSMEQKGGIWILSSTEIDDSGLHIDINPIRTLLLGSTFSEAQEEVGQLWKYSRDDIYSDSLLSYSFPLNESGEIVAPIFKPFKWEPSFQWNRNVLRNDIVSDLKGRDLVPTITSVHALIDFARFEKIDSANTELGEHFSKFIGMSLEPLAVNAARGNSSLRNRVTFLLSQDTRVRNILVSRE